MCLKSHKILYFCNVKIIKAILHFLTYSSIWVAFAVVALTGITSYNLTFKTDYNLLCFVFFATIMGYNFIKHYHPKIYIVKWSVFSVLNIVSFCFALFFFFQLKTKTQLAVILPFLISTCYAVSFGKKTLRTLSGFKIYAIAICWVLVTVVLPVIQGEFDCTTDFYLECVQRFAFVIAITIPFEIRDVQTDDKQLRTIPQRVGVKFTKLYGILLLMLFFFLEFFKVNIPIKNLIILPLIFLASVLFVVCSSEKQGRFYASFFVEGVPLIWGLLWLVL